MLSTIAVVSSLKILPMFFSIVDELPFCNASIAQRIGTLCRNLIGLSVTQSLALAVSDIFR